MRQHKVYVINRSGHDFSDAERFGELIYLSEGTFDPWSVNSMYRQFSEAMKDSKSSDYILPTGLSIMIGVAFAVFSSKHNKLNLLLFKNNRYIDRKIILESSNKEE